MGRNMNLQMTVQWQLGYHDKATIPEQCEKNRHEHREQPDRPVFCLDEDFPQTVKEGGYP
jgi:hypothetical protein